jgi:hypothetical protein
MRRGGQVGAVFAGREAHTNWEIRFAAPLMVGTTHDRAQVEDKRARRA